MTNSTDSTKEPESFFDMLKSDTVVSYESFEETPKESFAVLRAPIMKEDAIDFGPSASAIMKGLTRPFYCVYVLFRGVKDIGTAYGTLGEVRVHGGITFARVFHEGLVVGCDFHHSWDLEREERPERSELLEAALAMCSGVEERLSLLSGEAKVYSLMYDDDDTPSDLMQTLAKLAIPHFADGAEQVYVARSGERWYVGKKPAESFSDKPGSPVNVVLTQDEFPIIR